MNSRRFATAAGAVAAVLCAAGYEKKEDADGDFQPTLLFPNEHLPREESVHRDDRIRSAYRSRYGVRAGGA